MLNSLVKHWGIKHLRLRQHYVTKMAGGAADSFAAADSIRFAMNIQEPEFDPGVPGDVPLAAGLHFCHAESQ